MNKYPDFTTMDLGHEKPSLDVKTWENVFTQNTASQPEDFKWMTNEQIGVGPLYTREGYQEFEHLDFTAGIAPYLRGPYATMYVTRPWTVRQYAGFSTAEESNAFYKRNLAAGQKVYLLPLIWPHIEVMIQTMKEW